jgi:hypothetical protein
MRDEDFNLLSKMLIEQTPPKNKSEVADIFVGAKDSLFRTCMQEFQIAAILESTFNKPSEEMTRYDLYMRGMVSGVILSHSVDRDPIRYRKIFEDYLALMSKKRGENIVDFNQRKIK